MNAELEGIVASLRGMPSADRFLASDTALRPQDGTQTNCRGSDASCKQGLRTNSWSSNRIRDVCSLPVAPLALPKCSSVFDMHTIDLEPRGLTGAVTVTQNFYGFCFFNFRTVQAPF